MIVVEIRQLRYFVEVCKYESFIQAAKHSFISPQGINLAITRLEKELGTHLFVKDSRGIGGLTVDGEYLLERAKQVIELVDECEDHFLSGVKKNRLLQIPVAQGALVEFLNSPITKYRHKYADSVYLKTDEATDIECEEAVERETAEIAVTSGPVKGDCFDTELLSTERRVLIVNWEHELADRESIGIKDLKDYAIYMFGWSTRAQEAVRKVGREHGFEANINATVNNILSMYYFVESNSDIVGITTMSLTNFLVRDTVKTILLEDPEINRTLHMIKKKGRHLSQPAEAFWNIILEYRESLAHKDKTPRKTA